MVNFNLETTLQSLQSCPTLCNPMDYSLCPWDSPGKNTRVGCHALLQGIMPTQGSNPCLLHCRLYFCIAGFFTTEPPGKPSFHRWLVWNGEAACTTVVKTQTWASPPQFKPRHCWLYIVWPWGVYLTSLGLWVPICKIEILITYLIEFLGELSVFLKHLEQCLAC